MTLVLDLSSRGIAAANREFLLAMLPDYCDILFANEDEFVALTDLPLREGLELFSQWNMEVVLKRAELGAVWAGSGRILSSPVRALGPVDETGAGDAFAGAFLYGRSLGLPPERCLRLGNRIAGELLRVPGFGIDPEQLRASASALL